MELNSKVGHLPQWEKARATTDAVCCLPIAAGAAGAAVVLPRHHKKAPHVNKMGGLGVDQHGRECYQPPLNHF
jgi:hypothetical protein